MVTGGGGVFSDPIADAAEESQEVVAGFFASASQYFDDHRRELYATRKKATISTALSDSADCANISSTTNSALLFDVNNW